MIILDTNIISEIMKSQPNTQVIAWFGKHNQDDYYITSISVAEIYYGIMCLPQGKRKTLLFEKFNQTLADMFVGKVISFSEEHGEIFGKIKSNCRAIGRPIDNADAQIASITDYHQATLATRNTKDFINCEINLVNPFLI